VKHLLTESFLYWKVAMANFCSAFAILLKLWQCAARPVSLQLERKSTSQIGDEKSAPHFVGKVQLGSEAEVMEVLFETGSGSLVFDSMKCKSPACLKHHRYSPSQLGLNRFGQEAASGDRASLDVDEGDFAGQVTGSMVSEKMCFGEVCLHMGMLAVSNMTDEPFMALPADGIVGLSLKGLSISKHFNFLDQLPSAGLSSQFAIFLGDDAGEITFGGYNPARLESSLTWVPVQTPEDGFWQIRVVAVFAGTDKLELCEEGCLAIIDSSSPYIQVPEDKLHHLTQQSVLSCGGKDLSLVLENGLKLTLSANDYKDCTQRLHPWKKEEQQNTGVRKEGSKVVIPGGVDTNSLVLGEPLLQKYYTVFDALKKSVAFGLAKQHIEEDTIMLMQGMMRPARHEL